MFLFHKSPVVTCSTSTARLGQHSPWKNSPALPRWALLAKCYLCSSRGSAEREEAAHGSFQQPRLLEHPGKALRRSKGKI